MTEDKVIIVGTCLQITLRYASDNVFFFSKEEKEEKLTASQKNLHITNVLNLTIQRSTFTSAKNIKKSYDRLIIII